MPELSEYWVYRTEQDPVDHYSARQVMLVRYELPNWSIAEKAPAVVDTKLRCDALGRWGACAVRMQPLLDIPENTEVRDILTRNMLTGDEYVYCAVGGLSQDGRLLASYSYSPLNAGDTRCAGCARYIITDLVGRTTLCSIDRCLHSPEHDFAGFVEDATAYAYVLASREAVEGWPASLNAAVDAIRRDGSVTRVVGLKACMLRASPAGEQVLLIRADEEREAVDLEMRSARLDLLLWRRSVAMQIVGLDAMWSEDSGIVVAFFGNSQRGRAIFYSAVRGDVLLDSETPFRGLTTRGPIALVRRGTAFEPMDAFGLRAIEEPSGR